VLLPLFGELPSVADLLDHAHLLQADQRSTDRAKVCGRSIWESLLKRFAKQCREAIPKIAVGNARNPLFARITRNTTALPLGAPSGDFPHCIAAHRIRRTECVGWKRSGHCRE